jgi:hypothetical protein
MALYGTFSNTSKVFEQEHVEVSNASVTYAYLTERTLDPGTWLIHCCYSPSQDNGEYPGSDPDPYELGINVGGSIVAHETGYESTTGGVYSNQRTCSLFYVHQSTSSVTAKIGYRQGPGESGDGDSGGTGGRLTYQMYRLSDYA